MDQRLPRTPVHGARPLMQHRSRLSELPVRSRCSIQGAGLPLFGRSARCRLPQLSCVLRQGERCPFWPSASSDPPWLLLQNADGPPGPKAPECVVAVEAHQGKPTTAAVLHCANSGHSRRSIKCRLTTLKEPLSRSVLLAHPDGDRPYAGEIAFLRCKSGNGWLPMTDLTVNPAVSEA